MGWGGVGGELVFGGGGAHVHELEGWLCCGRCKEQTGGEKKGLSGAPRAPASQSRSGRAGEVGPPATELALLAGRRPAAAQRSVGARACWALDARRPRRRIMLCSSSTSRASSAASENAPRCRQRRAISSVPYTETCEPGGKKGVAWTGRRVQQDGARRGDQARGDRAVQLAASQRPLPPCIWQAAPRYPRAAAAPHLLGPLHIVHRPILLHVQVLEHLRNTGRQAGGQAGQARRKRVGRQSGHAVLLSSHCREGRTAGSCLLAARTQSWRPCRPRHTPSFLSRQG